MLHGVHWILFDAVGTLIYADPPAAEVYAAVGRRFGSKLDVAEVRRRFVAAMGAEQVAEGLERPPTSELGERERWRRIVGGIIDDVEDRESVFEELWRHFARPRSWRVYDDVADALERLSERGFRLGIASNFDSRLREVVAGHVELGKCEAVFVSSEVGYAKPDPRFFVEVERWLRVSPAEIALVGDDWVNDVEGAKGAAWRAVFLDREASSSSPLAIGSLRELV